MITSPEKSIARQTCAEPRSLEKTMFQQILRTCQRLVSGRPPREKASIQVHAHLDVNPLEERCTPAGANQPPPPPPESVIIVEFVRLEKEAFKPASAPTASMVSVPYCPPVPDPLPVVANEPAKSSLRLDLLGAGASAESDLPEEKDPIEDEEPSQKPEVRGQRSEVRGQRSEVRSQRSEVRGPRSTVRSQRSARSAKSRILSPKQQQLLPTADL
jgi:hypothetical protein